MKYWGVTTAVTVAIVILFFVVISSLLFDKVIVLSDGAGGETEYGTIKMKLKSFGNSETPAE